MDLSKIKIVFAEDNVSITRIVVHKLSSDGFQIIHFPSGEGVLDSVIENKPDLVILDIMMPVKDGLTVLKEIRETPEVADIPIILLTATKDDVTVIKSLKYGVSDYIIKPFSIAVLSERIKKVIQKTK
jgi:DNA-binding response OmpR family regulator